MARRIIGSKHSLEELAYLKPEYDSEGNVINREQVLAEKQMEMYRLKYNLLRQKLFLKELIKTGICENSDKPYDRIVEVAPCMALSMGRLIFDPNNNINTFHDMRRKWILVSEDYDPFNPFGFIFNGGVQGKLIVTMDKTKALKNVYDYYGNEGFKGVEAVDIYSDERKCLIIAQGCPFEQAFSLALTNCDIVFGDIYSELDKATAINYDNLYQYLMDIRDSRMLSEIEVCESSNQNGLIKKLIYMSNNGRIKRPR